MNSDVTQKIIKTDSLAEAERILVSRRDEILAAIGERTIEPTPEVMLELMELNTALGDAEYYPGVQQ